MDPNPKSGALQAAAQAPQGGSRKPTSQEKELFDLLVGRSLGALAQDAQGLDAALKSDPITGAVEYGTRALREVAGAAEDAGKPVPFEVLLGAGQQVIKEIAAIANEKGYVADEELETFLKEVFQQSIAKYAQLDVKEGKMRKQDLGALQQFAPAQQPPGAAPQTEEVV
jgi:hypothetical protein